MLLNNNEKGGVSLPTQTVRAKNRVEKTKKKNSKTRVKKKNHKSASMFEHVVTMSPDSHVPFYRPEGDKSVQSWK